MKRYTTFMLTLCLFMALAAFANDKNKDAKKDMGKDATVSGWVTDPACGRSGKTEMLNNAECTKKCAKDGKYVLVTDGDSKVWAVTNSEVLKGHEGHHVKVTGHPDADAGTIQIASVTMLEDQNLPTGKKSDAKHDKEKEMKK
jgi:hypothetical protein